MPKLWNDTIDAHRQAVRDAILDATAVLVHEHGLTAVTMSQVAAGAGIGRATLYKYFGDVEAILADWHERQVAEHVRHLAAVRDQAGTPDGRLTQVLEAYALITYRHHGTELVAALHRGAHVAHAEQQLREMVRDLIAEGAQRAVLRVDVAPAELAEFCLHALSAANRLTSEAAVSRLVMVTVAGLHPGHEVTSRS